MIRLLLCLTLVLITSTADGAIIMNRMSGTRMHWTGAVPDGRENDLYRWSADVYLTEDLDGGIVWLRSDYEDKAWTVTASPMHTDDAMFFSGEDMQLTLWGDVTRDRPRLWAGEIDWWHPDENPENYVTSLNAEGFLFRVASW